VPQSCFSEPSELIDEKNPPGLFLSKVFPFLSSVLFSCGVQYRRKQNVKLNIKQNIKHKLKECQVPSLPVDIKRWLIKILIDLTGMSASSIAGTIGVHRSGLTEWLKGRTTLGPESQDKVLKVLGIIEGDLDQERVHVWKIFDDLTSFRELLSWVRSVQSKREIPEIVRLAPLVPGPERYLHIGVKLYGISGPFRALVRRSITTTFPIGSIYDIEELFWKNSSIKVLKWRENVERDGEFGNEPTLRIDSDLFNKWWFPVSENQNISPEEFDKVLDPFNPVSDSMLQNEPDWALIELITGKKCSKTVSIRNLFRMTPDELRETLGLTNVQTNKLSAALLPGERLASRDIDLSKGGSKKNQRNRKRQMNKSQGE
jgi:transcriptional regulator with XRE-family HTH domain